MEPREIKGLEIAAKSKITRKGNVWLVPSQSNRLEKYKVALNEEKPECTCRDYEFRNERIPEYESGRGYTENPARVNCQVRLLMSSQRRTKTKASAFKN